MLYSQQFTIGGGGVTSFGVGAINKLPARVASLGLKRALIVTDRGVAGAGIAAEVARLLADAGIEFSIFADVLPNPDIHQLDAAAVVAREFGWGVVVAVGGGSVLDTGKILALMTVNQGPARSFEYPNQPANPGLPVIAIPTTTGTGSETNGWGVIEDPEAQRKFYAGHTSVTPRFSILDPDLSRGLPPAATAASGIDVLSHALESLSSRRANPFAEGIALQCVRMTCRYLLSAVADGQNLEARAQMLLAAHMAGLAFASTGLGLDHAIGHALSAHLGTSHGVALAAMLPHVLRFNFPVRADLYARLADCLGVSDTRRSPEANALAALEAIDRIGRDIGLPSTLRELDCPESVIPAIAADALSDSVIDNAPRMPSEAELLALLWAAF